MSLRREVFIRIIVLLPRKALIETKNRTLKCLKRFSHDVTKIQTKKLSILPRFYFHDVLEQRKTNFHTNFRFKRVLGLVLEYA